MNKSLLPLIVLLVGATTLCAEEKQDVVGTKELRSECHAYFYYTAALAEESHKPRMELLNQAIKLNPRLARAYYNRGSLYMDENDLPRASDDFKQAVQIDSSFINAHYNLACVYSMQSQANDALASLEKALASGYSKLDKIPDDPDLKNIKGNPEFTSTIAKYQSRAATAKLNVLQRFQNADFEGRGEILVEAIHEPNEQSKGLAAWSMFEPDYQIRVLSTQLWRKLDDTQSEPALVCCLYDANGYVNKAASNCLIGYRKDTGALMMWVLDDRGTPAPLYALQILAAGRTPKAETHIEPYLRDEDFRLRMMAADSLVRLRAVSDIGLLQAALQVVPEDKKDQEFYSATMKNAIEELQRVKSKGDNRTVD